MKNRQPSLPIAADTVSARHCATKGAHRRPVMRPLCMPFLCLLWLALLTTCVSAQQQATLEACRVQLAAGDKNGDGFLNKVEYINFLLRLSPDSPECPDLGNISEFLEGGEYYEVFETTSCYCLDYDLPTCCDTPQLRVPGTYPGVNNEEYTRRVCTDVIAIIDKKCNPTESPTAAPTENIEERPAATSQPTDVPTSAPSTLAPTEAPTSNTGSRPNSPSIVTSRGDEDEKTWRSKWLRIALPFFGLAFIACILLLVDASRRNRRKQKQLLTSKSLIAEDDDSLRGYPEVLEATENFEDDTEKTMEEGRIHEVGTPPMKISAVSNTATTTPERRTKKKVNTKSRKVQPIAARKNAPATTTSRDVQKPMNEFDGDNGDDDEDLGDLPDPRKTALPPPDSPQRMSMFLDSLELEDVPDSPSSSSSAKTPLKPGDSSPAKADSRSRMKSFFKDSDTASGGDSTASAEFFVDEHDDDTGGTETRWRLLPPTTLVPTGAVEVFPLPPVSTRKSSSSSYSGESKEEEFETDSVADMYVMEGSAQPDPDGVRLEDGRQYREAWSDAST